MKHPETVKVVDPTGTNPFIIINKDDLTDEYELFEEPKDKPTRAELDSVLASLPGDHTDPEYVVNGLRRHFGDLFTVEDETKVRELVKPVDIETAKAAQLKTMLDEKGIQYRGNASREDLLALLKDQEAK